MAGQDARGAHNRSGVEILPVAKSDFNDPACKAQRAVSK